MNIMAGGSPGHVYKFNRFNGSAETGYRTTKTLSRISSSENSRDLARTFQAGS
jgi:hypothetical protein